MKKFIPYVALILLLPAASSAQSVSGRFSSSFYTWEKYDTVDQSDLITRLYQNVELNAGYGDVSFHTFMNGAIGGAGSMSENGQVRVYNAYLRWKNIGGVAEARIGRVPVFAGVGNGVVDGLSLKSDLSSQITLSAYGGGNVSTALRSDAFDNLKDNYFAGAQAVARFPEGVRLGLSYMNRQREVNSYWTVRPDSAYNPVTLLVEPPNRKEQLLGADALYDIKGGHSLYGRVDYDLNASELKKLEFDGRLSLTGEIAVTGTFIHRTPRIFYNTFFTLFPTESVQELEGGVEYRLCPWANAMGRIAYVMYDDDNSMRYTAGILTNYGGLKYAGSSGYAGDLHSVAVDAAYPLYDRLITPNVGLEYSLYDLSGAGSESMIAALAGVAVHPARSVSIDLQAQFLRNKIMDSDMRIFGKVSYWFSHQFANAE